MKRIVLVMVALLLVGAAYAQNRDPKKAGHATRLNQAPSTVGTVTYDTGAPADQFHLGNPSSGNLFDTNAGAPLIPGTVNQITLYAGTYFNLGSFTIFPNTNLTGSVYFIGTFASNTFNVFSFSPVSVNSVFLAGMNGSLGFVTATTAGQGYHGQAINWQTGTFTSYADQNAMARITGDILPVELMRFDVD